MNAGTEQSITALLSENRRNRLCRAKALQHLAPASKYYKHRTSAYKREAETEKRMHCAHSWWWPDCDHAELDAKQSRLLLRIKHIT
jgi:hypothetical protein